MHIEIPTIRLTLVERKSGKEVFTIELPALIAFGIVFITVTLLIVAVRAR
jgi:hypothetical protein